MTNAPRALRFMPAADEATPFTIHAAAYWAARGAYEAFRDTQDGSKAGYDEASTTLISAMDEAARLAIQVPARSTAEICAKVAIFEFEQLHDDGNKGAVRLLIDYLVDDIKALAPEAYPQGFGA